MTKEESKTKPAESTSAEKPANNNNKENNKDEGKNELVSFYRTVLLILYNPVEKFSLFSETIEIASTFVQFFLSDFHFSIT